MLTVGISAHYHDASCCLLKDGELVAAAQEERFSRLKNDASLPVEALRYCLGTVGAQVSDIATIAYADKPALKFERQLWSRARFGTSAAQRFKLDAGRAEREIREFFGFGGPIACVGHHLSHAASAFYYSGFERAALLTADAVGEWTTLSFACGDSQGITMLEELDYPHSIGLLYSLITSFLGFEVNEGEYKTMGLAPYGRPTFKDKLTEIFKLGPGSSIELDLKYFSLGSDALVTNGLTDLLGSAPRAPGGSLQQFHYDVARSIQELLEEVMLEKATELKAMTGSKSLGMAGGVALNCVANSRIRASGLFDDVFVQPAAGDAGGALGAAAAIDARINPDAHRRKRMNNVYLGPSYSTSSISTLLNSAGVPYSRFDVSDGSLQAHVARLLASGNIVGWCCGRAEFGPRALGARSILADPRQEWMRDRVNQSIKFREQFRPFAPCVLEEHAHKHFAPSISSPFMLFTAQCLTPSLLPAVTHVDGSARVQTVNRAVSPLLHSLIDHFYRITGCPVLLNTSFNLRGEPVVNDPVDALLTFARCNLDTLVLEGCVIDRASLPPNWQGMIGELPGAVSSPITHSTYTLT